MNLVGGGELNREGGDHYNHFGKLLGELIIGVHRYLYQAGSH